MSTETVHLVIRASAGSGKTFQLTNRYLQRLLAGTAADEILAATFTRKAAGEILERVLSRLAKAATSDAEASRLAHELEDTRFSTADFQASLARLLRDLHRLRVGTLDSFFARLATNFTLELGLPPAWRIADELDDQQLRSRAIATVLREERTAEVVRLTNLLAKGDATRSVSGLIRSTVDRFYDVFRETDSAAWQRFPELHRLSREQLNDAIAALESVELPTHKSIAKAHAADVEAARTECWDRLIDNGIGKKILDGESTYYGKQLSDAVTAIYRKLIDHARAVLVQELAHQTLATRQLLERFDLEYQKLKREHRSLRFDDVTHRLRTLFATQDPHELAYRLDGHVRHLLLDEFQDTSPAQWQVLRPFAERICLAESDTSFFCVGDVKQAIYGWRGGVAEIFDALDEHLTGLKDRPLSKSYRSSPPVIAAVNQLFAGLTNHPDLDAVEEATVRARSETFPEHTTARVDLSGYACVVTAAVEEAENAKPADDILPSAARRVADIARDVPWASVGVLLRRNDDVAEVMNLLRELGVPASEEGGSPITDSAAVLTILSLLKLSDHPGDTISRFHIACSPLGESLNYRDHDDDDASARLAADIRQMLVSDGYGPSLERWCHVLAPAVTARDVMRLGQLIELGYRFDHQATLRPSDFVRFVEQERFPDSSADRVRVMTIHAAKGLEFDVVVAPLTERQLTGQAPSFVIGRNGPTGPIDHVCLYRKESIQKLLPDEMQQIFASARSREIHETLCRLYVTVTRAVYALHIMIPASSPSEKKLPRCSAGLVRAALTNGSTVPPDEIIYEVGDREWFRKVQPPTTEIARVEPIPSRAHVSTSVERPVMFSEMSTGRGRGMARVAPSRHDVLAPVRMGRILQSENAPALRRGTLIHSWFEQITWLDDERPSHDDLRRIAENQRFPGDEAELLLEKFDDIIRHPKLAQLLSRSSYRSKESLPFGTSVNDMLLQVGCEMEVRQELSIVARLGTEVTIGSIDRLVLLRRGTEILAADIIDFKTDAVDPAREPEWSERIVHYRDQLTAYGHAVSRIFGLPMDHIAARLAFVEPRVIVDVDMTKGSPEVP